jgi:hypothetical protein
MSSQAWRCSAFRLAGTAEVTKPAVADLVRGHQLQRRPAQGRFNALQRGLGLRIAAHRQHQLAAAVDEAQGQRRQAGRRLGLDHDVQRQLQLLGMADDGHRTLQPAGLGLGQVGGATSHRRQRQGAGDHGFRHGAKLLLPSSSSRPAPAIAR